MLYLVIFGEKFSSNSPKISKKKKLVTHLDKIRSALTENNNIKIFHINEYKMMPGLQNCIWLYYSLSD